MPPFPYCQRTSPYCQRTSPYCQRTISALPTSLFLPSGLSFLYCQHTISVLPTHPVLSHGYQQPYCKRTIPVLSTCQFRIVTTPFRIANTPFPAKRTSIPLPQARLTSHANTKRGAAQHLLHGSSQKKRRRLPTLPHCIAVPSAPVGLTSLFGMGRGGTPPQ